MNAGMDPLTSNRLSQVPPNDPDTTFIRSIRLGNHCGGGQQAERLIYQFKVQPQNALLVLYYALSLQNGQHTAAVNPEFVIEVQVGTPTASTNIQNLNTYNYTPVGDELFYGQPTPAGSGTDVSPFYLGKNGTHTGAQYEDNLYLPWNKVVINLGAYINKPVRILIGTGDCAYSAHYGYSYIAGYCRSMKINVDGCPIGSGDVVSTLRAPSGLEDPSYTGDPTYHAYQWYICNNTNIIGNELPNSYADSTEWFNRNFTIIPGANSSTYNTQIGQFMMNGRVIPQRAYACVMTTYMNKSTGAGGRRTYPITSRLFADATNQKPQVQMDQLASCDGKVKLTSTSYCGTPNYMVNDSTKWKIYDNAAGLGNAIATYTGNIVDFQSTQAGTYYAKMHVPTIDEGCYSEKTFEVTAIANPVAVPFLSNEEPCLGDNIDVIDHSVNATGRTWIFSDGETSNDSIVSKNFSHANDTVKIIVTNDYEEILNNDLTNTRKCSDSAIAVVHVFTSPELQVSDDTIVCEGKKTNVTINVVDNDPDAQYKYEWYRHLDMPGETRLQEGNVLQQIPDANAPTSKYYVKVTRLPQGCIAWDSVTVRVVRPTLQMIPSNGKICPGETVKLIAGNAHHYSWTATPADPSLEGQESATTIEVTPTESTTYTLIGHGSDDCNADPLTKTITIFPTPIPRIEITPDFVDSEEPVVTFNDVSQYGESTKWDFGDGKTSTERKVSHTFNNVSLMEYVTVNMTSYNVLGNQSEGCHANTSIDIPIQLFSVWIPNAFTPTMAENKTFGITTANILEYFSVRIFDRHGQQVFYSTDQKFSWDGTYKGVLCPQGAYVYMIKYRRPGTPEITERKGTLTLIR